MCKTSMRLTYLHRLFVSPIAIISYNNSYTYTSAKFLLRVGNFENEDRPKRRRVNNTQCIKNRWTLYLKTLIL